MTKSFLSRLISLIVTVGMLLTAVVGIRLLLLWASRFKAIHKSTHGNIILGSKLNFISFFQLNLHFPQYLRQ